MRYSRVRRDRTGLTMVIMTRGGMFLLVLFTSVLANEHDHRYEVRADGLRSAWWPKNTHGEHAFMHQAMQVFNEQRVAQRLWFNTRENRQMTRSEVRSVLKHDLMATHGNKNLN